MPYINASKNAGLKKNRITKRQSTGYINASGRDEKNRGGLLGGAGYLLGSAALGLGGVVEGIGDLGSAAGDLIRGDTAMAKYRFLDNDTADAQQRLRESYNPNKAMELAGDVSSGIGNSLVFMIPYVGPYLAGAGYAGMGISNAAEKTGNVGGKEIAYGLTSGALEFGLEKLTGGIGKAGKNIGSAVTRKLGREAVESTAKATGRSTARLAGKITGRGLAGTVLKETLKGAGGEATEEALAEIIDPTLLKLFNIDEDAKLDWRNVAYAGLVGGLSGGLMTAGPAAINYKSAVKAGREIRTKGEAEEVVNYAKSVLNAAKKTKEKKNAASEAAKAPKDASAIKKVVGAVNPLSESRKQTRAGKQVESIADKLSKNVDAYEKYLQNPNKTEKELEVSDAILGELRGNLFILENASLLEIYEEGILELADEDKQELVDEINRQAKSAQREKSDYTVADLVNNTDDILTTVAAERMQEDAYGDLFRGWHDSEDKAQTATETAQAAGTVKAEEVAAQPVKPVQKRYTGTGAVRIEGGKQVKDIKLSNDQYVAYKAAEILAPTLGADIEIHESMERDGKQVNGRFDPSTNTIHININAMRSGKQVALYTLGHEVTHYVKEWSPEKFSALAEFVAEHLGESRDALVAEKRESLKRLKLLDGLTEQQAADLVMEEVVADGMELILTDGKVLNDLAKRDRTLWQKVKSWIQNIIAKIKKAYGELNQASKTAQVLKETLDSLEELERMFTEGVTEAGERARTAENIIIDESSGTALFSIEDIPKDQTEVDAAVNRLVDKLGVDRKRAEEWVQAELSLATLILRDDMVDYAHRKADRRLTAIVKNSDYKQGTLDFSNICRKRREYTRMMQRIQSAFPNRRFTAEEFATIRQIMVDEGLEVACGLCYVEDRRQNEGYIAESFQKAVESWRDGNKESFYDTKNETDKAYSAGAKKAMNLIEAGDYVPTIADLTTVEGMERLQKEHNDLYRAWKGFNNARGMASARLLTGEAEYQRQILKYNKAKVKQINDLGGLRVFSFSDFEEFHLIDIIQAVQDCAAMGIKIQFYTKVPSFALLMKDTKAKGNLSLIPKGDLGYRIEDGRVVLEFDPVEGIDYNDPAFKAVASENKNIGTILVGINDTQIRAAMEDEFIDYIIPFHTGQSTIVRQIKKIGRWENYKDVQTDKPIVSGSKAKAVNIYTDVIAAAEREGKPIKNERQFVERFLKVCEERELTPRFEQFLDKNSKGQYVYTKGYYKLLLDFKMFDKNGKYLPQEPVVPEFDADLLHELTKKYVEGERKKVERENPAFTRALERVEAEVIGGTTGARYSIEESHADTADEEKSYRYYNEESPMSQWGHAMFVDDPYGSETYGKYAFSVAHKELTDIEELKETIAEKIEEDYENGDLPEDMTYAIDEMGESPGTLADEFDPSDIVMSAQAWDNGEMTAWIYDRIIDPMEIKGVKTRDGAIVFDEEIIHREYELDFGRTKYSIEESPTEDPFQAAVRRMREREAAEKPKAPYSGKSFRRTLAEALEDTVETDAEYKVLKDYSENIESLDDMQKQLDDLNEKASSLREIQFYSPDAQERSAAAKELQALYKERNRIEDEMAKGESKLAKIRQADPIRNLMRSAERSAKKELEKKEEARAQSREITSRVRTVRRILGTLNTMLYHPNKQKHVPQALRDLTETVLRSADPKAFAENRKHIREMSDLAAKIERLEKKAAKTALEQESLDKWKNRYEYLEANTISTKRQAEALLTAFETYQQSTTDDITFDKALMEKLGNYVKEIEEAPLSEMTLKSITAVEDFYKMLKHQIDNANTTFATERALDIDDLGKRAADETEENKSLKFMSPKPGEPAILSGVRKYFWKNMKPLTVFEAIGSETFRDLFKRVMDGEGVWAKDIMEAREKILDAREKHGYKDWKLDERVDIKTKSGTVALSLSERMALYAYSFRNQAISHLEGGGFVLDPQATSKGKILSALEIETRLNDPKRYVMDPMLMGELAETLTAEQKAYVEEMQKYLTEIGEKGNEVSMKLYGIKLFTEEYYFPIKVKSEYLASQTGKSGDPNIKNRGMTKEVVPNAKDPLVLQGFDEIMVDHINSMATYHAFVLPVEDLVRVLNYKPANYLRDENGEVVLDEDGNPKADPNAEKDYSTLKAVIESKYGAEANNYIVQLIRDLNGGARRDAAAGIIDKGITAFKRASTMASLSVLVQQPTSLLRAAAYIDPKYLFGNASIVDFKNHAELWERVKKYAPVAIIKEMGGYDTGVGARTGDYLNAAEYEKGERLKGFATNANYRAEVFGMGAAYADEMAWIQLFEACISEQADKLGETRDSEKVLQAAGERFTEIIRRTQVYDSTLTRSENMRSKDTGMKMATAFMAEPTTIVSMIADAIIKGERGDIKFLRNTAGAVAASILVNALAASLVYALRDDDEEKTYTEKYISTLAFETADSFNPLGYLPVARDILSIMQGYEVERSDLTLVQNLMDQVEMITSSKRSVQDKLFGVSGAVSAFFGVPLTNIYRDAKGFSNLFMTQTDTETTTGRGVSAAVKEEFSTIFGLFDKQTQNAYQLYKAAMSGDTAHYNRVAARYESEQAVEQALRKELRENDERINEAAQARLDGELDVYESIVKQIETEGHFDRNIVIRAINNEINAINDEDKSKLVPKDESAEDEEGGDESLYKTSDLNAALERGDKADFADIYESLLADRTAAGKTEAQAKSALKSSITAYWKKQYLAAWEENDTAEIKRIQSILLSTGLYGTRNDVATMGQEWVKKYAASKTKK